MSVRVGSNASRWAILMAMARWDRQTPFDRPVVPPVYWSVARSSGDGSGGKAMRWPRHAVRRRPVGSIAMRWAMPNSPASSVAMAVAASS